MAEMADPLARLTADDFHRHLHKTFELKAPGGEVVKVQLTAIVASEPALPAALKSHKGEDLCVRSGGAFSLNFVARAGKLLPQGTYPLKHGKFGPFGIFLTPNAQSLGVGGYHAVFS
jgi:hypothetical protein